MYRSESERTRYFDLGPNGEWRGLETARHRSIIAYRKTCNPVGTGLSHYILLTNPSALGSGKAGGLDEQ